MNNVNLIGHVAVDSKEGNGVVSSLMAVHRIYRSKDGQDTDFIPLSIFGKQAENFSKMVSKGQMIGIDGRIKTSEYADQNGEKRYGWTVIVSHFYLLHSGSHDGQRQQKLSQDMISSEMHSSAQQHQDENVYKVDKQLDNLDQILDTVKADEQAAKPVSEAKPAKQADDDESISPLPPLGKSSNRSHISGNDFSQQVIDSQPSVEQLEKGIAKLKSKALPF
jgi:single-strand DNA-binding protein